MNTEQERTEFEAWYRLHHGSRDVYGRDVSGEYVDKQVQGAFNVWQARAALTAQPAAATSMKDAEELRGIAAHFDALGKKLNGDFLREVANRHEILARAYRTSTVRYERELKGWIERGHTAEDKAAALKWLEEMRGAGECRADEGERQ